MKLKMKIRNRVKNKCINGTTIRHLERTYVQRVQRVD
mgnify:CR=1 FL=1